MAKQPKTSARPVALRRRAEARLRTRLQPPTAKAAQPHSAADTQRLFHELQVHQVELELQNAELLAARETAERALEDFTDLYDFAPVGYFTLDDVGTIQRVNLTGAALVGIERSRLVGRRFSLLMAAERQPVFNSFLKQVFTVQSKQSIELELWCPGQPPRIVNIEAQRMLDGSACRAAVMDITGRRQVENRVRLSEIRYRRLFEAAHDGVLILDPETRKITDANPFMTQLLGYPHPQLVGKELFEIGLLKDAAASQEMFRKLKRTHEVRYEDLPLKSRTGRHQEVEVVANLYDEDGRPVIQCNIRDITERKLAEELRLRNEALFSALIAQAPVGVYVVDARFRMLQVNRQAMPIFKTIYPLIGRDFSEVMQGLWSQRVAAQIVARFRFTLKTGKPYQSPPFAEQRRDTGVWENYEWQIQRVTLPAGEHGVVCFFNEITARKQAEAAQRRLAVLAATNQKLAAEILRRHAVEQSLKQNQQFQVGLLAQSRQMTEQLRQLSRQVLSAQEAERKRISRELHDVIAQALTSINVRLATLKKTALVNPRSLARSLANTQQLVEKSVDIVHRFARELRPPVLDDLGLIPALHAFLKDFTAQTGVRTRLTAFAGVEQLDTARRTVLFRVTQEALTNVARHAQASRVAVKIQKLPDFIRLEIVDDGKSFPVAQVLRAQGRRGLGLLGMKERLEMVGGQLDITSAPGQGTTVAAEIPLGKSCARGGGGADGCR